MKYIKNKLFVGLALGVGLTGGLNAMEHVPLDKKGESEKGIVSSVGSMLFSKGGLAASVLTATGLGWLISTSEQKDDARDLVKNALGTVIKHKMPVAGGVLFAGAAYHLYNKYVAVSSEKSVEEQAKNSLENLQEDPTVGLNVLHLLPPSLVEFAELVLTPLYKDNEQDEIKELCELFIEKPYALLFHEKFVARLSDSSSEVRESFGRILVNVYPGGLQNLFLDDSFVQEILVRLEDEKLQQSVFSFYGYLAKAMEAPHYLLQDKEFMKALCAKEVTSRLVFSNFIVNFSALLHQEYKQGFIDMMQEAGRDDILIKCSGILADHTLHIKELLSDKEVIKIDACVEWLIACVDELNQINTAGENFFNKCVKPDLSDARNI
ncbi:hypothetical protein H0W26_05595 [Candidatus Dependentiae bacterium]|nr:hypothetical protein [Candidatus Dependentiae bacterium]